MYQSSDRARQRIEFAGGRRCAAATHTAYAGGECWNFSTYVFAQYMYRRSKSSSRLHYYCHLVIIVVFSNFVGRSRCANLSRLTRQHHSARSSASRRVCVRSVHWPVRMTVRGRRAVRGSMSSRRAADSRPLQLEPSRRHALHAWGIGGRRSSRVRRCRGGTSCVRTAIAPRFQGLKHAVDQSARKMLTQGRPSWARALRRRDAVLRWRRPGRGAQ